MKKYLTFLVILLIPFLVYAENIEKNKELVLSDTDFNINEYFSIANNTSWSITDPSVASVVEGNIVPIKVGNTILTTTINNDRYVLNLEVVNPDRKVVITNKDINQVMADVDVKNPKTGDAMILLMMIIGLSLVTSLFFSTIMKHNKYEEE